MRVWLRILALLGVMLAVFGFAIVALVAAMSYSASGVQFNKTRLSSNLSISYGLAGENRHVELQWAERNHRPPAPGGLGRAVFVYTIVTRSPRVSISKPPSLLARLGFHWWTTQPDEASSPSFWRIPYRVGAPAWFVLPVSVLGCIWVAIQVARRWERLVATGHAAQGHCPACGYDLRATPDRCPECGRTPRKSTVAQAQIRGRSNVSSVN